MPGRFAPALFVLFLSLFAYACQKNSEPVAPADADSQRRDENTVAASVAEPLSDAALLVLSCPELKTVAEKTVERLNEDRRMPPVRISYLPSEKHLGEIVKGSLRYNVLLSEGKENWKLLAERGLVREKDGISLARNRIVFVALSDMEIGDNPVKFLSALPDVRVALASPLDTLAGIHAQQSLVRLGIWKKDERRGLWLDDRNEALAALADGRADVAVLYRSDALGHGKLKTLFVAPEGSHFDIVYYGMHLKDSGLRDAARYFLMELSGPDSAEDWKSAGFLPPPPHEP